MEFSGRPNVPEHDARKRRYEMKMAHSFEWAIWKRWMAKAIHVVSRCLTVPTSVLYELTMGGATRAPSIYLESGEAQARSMWNKF